MKEFAHLTRRKVVDWHMREITVVACRYGRLVVEQEGREHLSAACTE